jgi:hypothetical protein
VEKDGEAMGTDGKKRKLYLVDLRMQMMVWAADALEAESIAEENASEEVVNSGMEADGVQEITRARDIPVQWVDSLPYRSAAGENDYEAEGVKVQYEPTCGQIVGDR